MFFEHLTRRCRSVERLWTGQELVLEPHASSRIGRTSSTVLPAGLKQKLRARTAR